MDNPNASLSDERVDKFLQELTQLSKKHRITILGCGCCGSPTLDHLQDDLLDGEYGIRSGSEYTPFIDLGWTNNLNK